tara:strand:+ start:2988 stop:3659 length:672 start_codon:yes stop_codon:yes gene_type:complete
VAPPRLTIVDAALSLPIRHDHTLLQHCLAAELAVSRSCRNGNCGRCDSSLLKGRVKLRNGNTVEAPATIPLCIAFALDEVEISNLPLIKLPIFWRCQWQNSRVLVLPAGRQTPPHEGDICAVLFEGSVELNEIAEVNGRNIVLFKPAANTPEVNSVSLITIDAEHEGQYTLCREYKSQRQLVWQGINHVTARSAQTAYQANTCKGSYHIIHDASAKKPSCFWL